MFAKDVFWENKRWVKTKQVRFMIEMFQPIPFSSMEKKMKKSCWREKQNRDLISQLEWECKHIFLWENKKGTLHFFLHAFPSLVLVYSSLEWVYLTIARVASFHVPKLWTTLFSQVKLERVGKSSCGWWQQLLTCLAALLSDRIGQGYPQQSLLAHLLLLHGFGLCSSPQISAPTLQVSWWEPCLCIAEPFGYHGT